MEYWDWNGVRTKNDVEYLPCQNTGEDNSDRNCGFPTAAGRNTEYSYGFPMIQQTQYNGKKICGLLEMA
jgi:hypothetical protein